MILTENDLRRLIKEELTKQEVRGMISDKLNSYIQDREFKKAVRSIVADVTEELFRELWRKNGFWKNALKNG